MPDIVDRADPFSLCIGWKWGKPCRINPAFDCGDFPFDSGEPSLISFVVLFRPGVDKDYTKNIGDKFSNPFSSLSET